MDKLQPLDKMNIPMQGLIGPSKDSTLLLMLPMVQYEYVDVTFPAIANTETVIPYTRLKPENPEEVRWIEVTRGSDSTNNAAQVVRGGASTRTAWGQGFIVLMCNRASFQTRLLLFIERS